MTVSRGRPLGAAWLAVLLVGLVTLMAFIVVRLPSAATSTPPSLPGPSNTSSGSLQNSTLLAGQTRVLSLLGTVTRKDSAGRSGFEQTFTVAHAPAVSGPVQLSAGRLAAGVSGRLHDNVLSLRAHDGRLLARYGGLRVTDSTGRVLRSHIALQSGRVSLVIDDGGASYPLHVDPYVQIATLSPSASDTALGTSNGNRSRLGQLETFGTSVAESNNGDVLVVGGPADNSAFVFVKPSNGQWKDATPVARLRMNLSGQYPEFGESVAVSGDGKTIVVGEPMTAIGSGQQNGEAVVFTEPSKGWSHSSGYAVASFTAADTTGYFDYFGASVATDGNGDTITIGSPGWSNAEGAIYVFRRPSQGWQSSSEDKTLAVAEPGNAAEGGGFGQNVSMSSNGDVIATDAPGQSNYEGAVYVLSRFAESYTELQDPASGSSDPYFTCTGGDGYGVFNPILGVSVAVSSDGKTIAAGEQCAGGGGQAVVYTEPGHGWNYASGQFTAGLTPLRPEALYTSLFGTNVAVSGNGNTVLADDPVYPATGGYLEAFTRPARGWTHVNPPVAGNFDPIFTSSPLGAGPVDAILGAPLALSAGGGLAFAGTSGKGDDGAVNVYELSSDIPSATTVSCSPSSVDTGKTATCTATVKTKTPTATGRVSFSSTGGSDAHFDDKQCTLKKHSTGVASCHVKFTPKKKQSYTITARYGGDGNHGAGSGTTVVETPKDGTITQVACAPSTVTALSQTLCKATVTGAGTQAPTITFKTSPTAPAGAIGAETCSQSASTETCDVPITLAAGGSYTVAANYAGSSLDGSSDGSTVLVVAAAMNAMTASCSPSTINTGGTATCTATLSGVIGTAALPAISFSAQGMGHSFTGESCMGTSATETCSVTFGSTEPGPVRVQTSYAGNESNLGAGAEPTVQVENPIAVAVSCTGMVTATCTATVTDNTAAPISPTGTVTVTAVPLNPDSASVDKTCSLTAGSSSKSACSVSFTPAGNSYNVKASYPGDQTHGSGSGTTTYSDS